MISEIWDDTYIERRNRQVRSLSFFADPSLASKSSKQNHLSAPPGRSISARVFPNGEFGVGFVPPAGISAKDKKFDADIKYADMNAEITADIEIGEEFPEGFRYTRKIVPALPPKLGISSKSSQPDSRYGLKGITTYGRRMLRNAGHVMDVACKDRYNRLPQMGTLTIPSYSEDTMKRICQHWGDIVRRFFQECKRLYGQYRYRFDFAACTEIQPQRWRERHEVGLHIHFLFVAIRLGRNKWALPDDWVRSCWGRILQSYLDAGEDFQLPNYRRETVRNSSAAYIAKYASKGDGSIKEVLEEKGEEYIPHQWWSISNPLRRCIKQNTIRSRGTVADMLLCICSNGMEQYLRYVRCSTLTLHNTEYAIAHGCPGELVLGYGGLLSYDGKILLQPPDIDTNIRLYLSRTLDRYPAN